MIKKIPFDRAYINVLNHLKQIYGSKLDKANLIKLQAIKDKPGSFVAEFEHKPHPIINLIKKIIPSSSNRKNKVHIEFKYLDSTITKNGMKASPYRSWLAFVREEARRKRQERLHGK